MDLIVDISTVLEYDGKMKVPKAPAETILEIKKSKFLTFARPVGSLEEVKTLVKQYKVEHPGAAHVVHAAVTGNSGSEYSLSDDGEPKGTSGRPALEVLKGREITNIGVFIIRYFGGTKLGTGGLVKAYGNAAKAVLDILETEELTEKITFTLKLSYHDHPAVRQLLEKEKVEIIGEDFGSLVTLEGRCPASKVEGLDDLVKDLTRGAARLVVTFS